MRLSNLAHVLPAPARRAARRALVKHRHRGLHTSDAILVSYPKSGSTWLRFLLAHALTAQEVDFDSVRDVIPPVGRHRHAPEILPGSGRFVRSHEPLLPYLGQPGQPVVALIRDGREVALSYLAHEQRNRRWSGDVVEFLDRWLEGRFDSYGPWYEHVAAALDFRERNSENTLVVRYEDLRSETVDTLMRILEFLGIEDAEERREALQQVVAANTKDRMRSKEDSSAFLGTMKTDGSPFVRRDQRPDWNEMVPLHTRQRFERICAPALAAAGYDCPSPSAGDDGDRA